MMQGMPQGAQEAEGAQGAEPASGGAPALISGIQSGLKKLGMALEKAQIVPPEELQEFGDLVAGLDHFLEKLVSGGGEKPAPSGVSSVEAGSNPNAKPMMG